MTDNLEEHHHHLDLDHRTSNMILPAEEFAEDLELRLGRANGNIYYRKTGMEGIHDGQVMVRLKKKRFVILDYSIIPNDDEIQLATINPHIACPEGAGKRQCVTPGCTKVGVPVLLYDSDPSEPASLYLRSGLCFTCQRNLNEKRRTQRKRKSDLLEHCNSGVGEDGSGAGSHDAAHHTGPPHRSHSNSASVFTIASDQKKLKLNGSVVHLAPDAIVINGAINGAKHHGEGYGFHEIGIDLSHVVQDAVHETHRLIHAVSPSGVASDPATTVVVASSSSAAASAATVTPMVMCHLGDDEGLTPDNGHPQNNMLFHGNNESQMSGSDHAHHHNLSSEDIAGMYDKAFLSLSKSLFLLSQWKSAWDAEVAAAVAQETVHDACLADAVASAAAVVAATAELTPLDSSSTSGDLLLVGGGGGSSSNGDFHTSPITNSSSTNMVSLLLAAEQKGEDGVMIKEEDEEDDLEAVMGRAAHPQDVQTFEV
jgi:hypothetical protein